MSPLLLPVRDANLSGLAQLHAQCFPDEAWDSAALATVLAMPGADGRVICGAEGGMHGMILDQCLSEEAEILTLCVAPGTRRSGIGRALLLDLVERTRHAGAQRIVLEVAADNDAGLGLYDSLGFQRDGRRRSYYRRKAGPNIDAWRLSLSWGSRQAP
jgi:ribosomal-protein-alanine N-acetyltransferase